MKGEGQALRYRRTGTGLAAALAALLGAAGCGDARENVLAPQAEAPGAPAPAITTVGYTAVVGDDWKSYASKAQLRAQDYFSWPDPRDVYDFVDLVPDPVFGQVVRITQPVNCCVTAPTPRMHRSLPAPMDRMWYRWRMRYHPGWTSAGPDPAGHANSYKIGFWGWRGYNSRGEVGLTNTTDYYVAMSVSDLQGGYIRYAETKLPGSDPGGGLGKVTTDWTDDQWYEFVVYYERTSSTTARQHWWKRRLTTGGSIAPGPWTYTGIALSGGPTPQVDRIELGINKNKSTPVEQYIYWGPWEVVDGTRHPNPWSMPLP